jgi:hypothetical protein
MKKTILLVLVLALSLAVKVANADFTFGEPTNLGPVVNTASVDATNCISADNLELYFGSNRPGGFGDMDIWVSTRQSIDESWEPPVNLGATVNSQYIEAYPSLSSDGLTLYFSDLYSGTPRPGGLGGADIWKTTRTARSDPWTTPVNLGSPINSSAMDISPTVSGDGLILVFASSRTGTGGPYDLWLSTRADVQDPWGTPVNLGSNVNSSSYGELECSMSADGLALFFASGRPGGFSNYDLWMTTRKSRQDPWAPTVNVGSIVNSTSTEGSAGISSDMRTLCFDSDRPGGFGNYDLWESPIIPVVDLNGDGIVDAADMFVMVDHWNTDNHLCDIGPAPWGDGIVDVRDLLVLAGYMSPAPIAHWKLDEVEGMFAIDSAGNNDAIVVGSASWQPGRGQLDGALQLNGVDVGAIAGYVLSPSHGPFSIFTWVKVALPGRVIVSQQGVSDWLAVSADGKLMTELKDFNGLADPLLSETVITDGKWHRIGLIWDGSHRILCVDGDEVAEDIQPGLEGSQMGLYIGVDKNYAPGTFFSGLIDDVLIYDVALTPEQIEGLAQ